MSRIRPIFKRTALFALAVFIMISLSAYSHIPFAPASCQDSDSDCTVSNVEIYDSISEPINLNTLPYGWINFTGWNDTIPQDAFINEATIFVLWSTDTSAGASGINIDYWDGSSWTNCAGPFSESGTVANTSCNVTHLSKTQLNHIMARFRGEDSDGSPDALGYVDYAYLDINYTAGMPYLEAQLVYPNPSAKTNVIQNLTFTVNATVQCKSADCGNVNATLRYNMSSPWPDTDVSTSEGGTPFFIQELTASATKDCPSNPLDVDEPCVVTWIVNTTGNKNDDWKIGVLFQSDNSSVYPATSENSTVTILECTEDFSINWNSLSFGVLDPYTGPNSAEGNDGNEYNISINPGSCDIDIYIRGSGLSNETYNSTIDVGKILWSNTTNNHASAYNLTEEAWPVKMAAQRGNNVTTWYWINVPAIYAGKYNGLLTFTGVKNG